MACQPNDFVNPDLRGVGLPAGFKNLNDLLQKARVQKRAARTIFPLERGSLKDIPRFIQRLYMDHYGMALAVTIRATESILWIHNRHGGPRLSVLLRKQDTMLAQVIQNLFADIGFEEDAGEGANLVTASLPHLWLEAAQIVERVIRGYGAAEYAELFFHFVSGVE